METIIQTIEGTYIVPKDKHNDLIMWLQRNAVKAEYKTFVQEQNSTVQFHNHPSYGGTQLLAD
jgi:hypothetical protein